MSTLLEAVLLNVHRNIDATGFASTLHSMLTCSCLAAPNTLCGFLPQTGSSTDIINSYVYVCVEL